MEPMEKYQGHDEKQELHHVEDGKIVTDAEPSALQQGGLDTLSEARNPWKVLLENPKALALIMAVQSNAIIVGVEFSLPGNLLGITAFNKLFGVWSETDSKYAVEAKVLTIWGALFATFQVLGQFTGGECNDRFGRRLTLYSVIFFTMVGVMLEVIATTWQMWLGSKIVIGFATGIMQATVPCYVTEVSPREIRGIMLSFFNMAMNIGGLAATVIPWATNKRWPGEDDLRSFRVPLYVALAAPVLTLIAEVFLLVESPYWLMMKGRKEQARKALAFINPKSSEVDLDRAVAVLEYTLEKEAEANEQHRNTTYVDCFKGVDLRRTFCAVFPPISQNLTGQNLVGTYATYFFVIAKQSDPLISSVITTSVGLASNFISFFLIENKKIGRWMLLFVGIIVMTLCMLGLGITDVVAKSDFSQAQGSVLVALVSIFLAASTIGPGVAFAIRHSVGVPRSSNYHYYRLMAAIRRFQSAHACRGQSFGLSKMESWCQGRNRKPGYEGRIRKTSRLQHFVIIWLMSSD